MRLPAGTRGTNVQNLTGWHVLIILGVLIVIGAVVVGGVLIIVSLARRAAPPGPGDRPKPQTPSRRLARVAARARSIPSSRSAGLQNFVIRDC